MLRQEYAICVTPDRLVPPGYPLDSSRDIEHNPFRVGAAIFRHEPQARDPRSLPGKVIGETRQVKKDELARLAQEVEVREPLQSDMNAALDTLHAMGSPVCLMELVYLSLIHI